VHLALDPGQESSLNEKNMSVQHGDLAGTCGKVASPEPPLTSTVQCSFHDIMRNKYETMCADLTDLFLNLRAPLIEELDAVV
jgi:hypothetical protein